jgi:hypothetical protein
MPGAARPRAFSRRPDSARFTLYTRTCRVLNQDPRRTSAVVAVTIERAADREQRREQNGTGERGAQRAFPRPAATTGAAGA